MSNEEIILNAAKDMVEVALKGQEKIYHELAIVEGMLSYMFSLQGWTIEQYKELRNEMEKNVTQTEQNKKENK